MVVSYTRYLVRFLVDSFQESHAQHAQNQKQARVVAHDCVQPNHIFLLQMRVGKGCTFSVQRQQHPYSQCTITRYLVNYCIVEKLAKCSGTVQIWVKKKQKPMHMNSHCLFQSLVSSTGLKNCQDLCFI